MHYINCFEQQFQLHEKRLKTFSVSILLIDMIRIHNGRMKPPAKVCSKTIEIDAFKNVGNSV